VRNVLMSIQSSKRMMTRRDFLHRTVASAVAMSVSPAINAQTSRSKMGIATTSYMTVRRFRDTYEFLEHCHGLGATGIQSAINGDLPKIRARAGQLGMFIEAIAPLPKNGDMSGFEHAMQNAKAVGALLVRVNAGGRRYEDFSTLADYQAFASRSKSAIRSAVAICEKNKIPFALENHKDWTLEQIVEILKGYSSENVGACVDFGNNISLLDDPLDVVEQLAPYAVTTHVKDMGMESYPEGFLLSEVRLGEGALDLPRMFTMIRQARPKANLILEMITRDPLKVPCLTDNYWATFPDRSGRNLARTLRLVQSQAKRGKPLPRISQLGHEEQLRIEEDNVQACLQYAREKLNS
jgi:sugar phosphate isomerase/epimerase